MISPESRQILESMETTQYGRALREYLDSELEEIGDITKCTSWEDTQGRKHAIELIEKLFSFMSKKKTGGRTPNQYT